LVNNVTFNRFQIAPLADCAEVIAVAPEFSAPQLFFQVRKLPKNFTGGDALENPDHVSA